ncbi:unnamed protein product [Schistosoma margrebowiei]|uniref:Uncharacterized protein n=1 Tax=Schistosoma margrebowiei TaxID=48269 RepID=A0A3P8DBX7_9TREM|nr:unnamed protein product [Schistosoma margrebowiei]
MTKKRDILRFGGIPAFLNKSHHSEVNSIGSAETAPTNCIPQRF